MSILKNTRLSQDRQTEYQIEYTATKDGDEYRLRGGAIGTWTRWFPTKNITKLLADTGFIPSGKKVTSPTLLHDFYVESHFKRSTINLNREIVLELANNSGLNAAARHLYSRVKRTGFETWVLPTSAIETTDHFWYLYKIIDRNV